MESISSFASQVADTCRDAAGRNSPNGRGVFSPSLPVSEIQLHAWLLGVRELKLDCLSKPAAVASTVDTFNICWTNFQSQELRTLLET